MNYVLNGFNPQVIGLEFRDPWVPVQVTRLMGNTPVPLTIEQNCILPSAERYAHCEAAVKAAHQYQLPVLIGPSKVVIGAPCVVVGSGPSAIALLPEIKERYARGEQIIALKGAHDWLVRHGVVPAAAIALDGQRSRAKCFKLLQEHTLYMCASQMHPDTWRHLKGRRVLIWHSRIGVEQHKRPEWANTFLVPCAGTTGNSALYLLHLMGRRRFELYGYDSSIPTRDSSLQGFFGRFKGRLLKLDGARAARDKKIITVVVGGKRFDTTTELVHQVQEMPALLKSLPAIQVNAHGDGYYQAMLAEGKALGWPV